VSTEIKVGSKVTRPTNSTDTARVLAIAEGWAMLRYPHATPFVQRVTDLRPAPTEDNR
jgi:hypothetical protein